MTKLAVDLKRVNQVFGDYHALNNLTLQIPEGEVFGFLGHNGAGKTTTIHLLTTLTKPISGSGCIFGNDLFLEPEKVRPLIGYVPENVRLYESLTTRENLEFFAGLSGLNDIANRVDEAMEYLSIQDLANKRVGNFSKGMRQRVGLAQAIVHDPQLLFLDEPASGLDPLGMKMLRELIVGLNQEKGMTIFMNTHLISEIAKTCTSIGVLSRGHLVFHGDVEEVNQRFGDEAAMEQLYLSVQNEQREGAAA
jgi:ABC-2 type transport system ATP-binding protein